uniref:xanthine dehydrogenase family protein molybdopterin-binding subunit n=1 Tax=Streptomyces scabiei TaxID=1930 RepID=UPI0015C510B6
MSQPQAAVGAGLPRVDARLRVTGGAKYAADNNPDGVVHAVIVESSIGRGRITGIDTRAAEAEPGVLKVISHLNAPKLPPVEGRFPPGKPLRAFQDDRVQFFGQPVAVAVATTLEIAQHAASLVKVSYAAETSSTDLSVADAAGETQTYARGDADRALDSAPVRLESAYRTARNHHNPMEPAGIVAHWAGDRLTVWEKTQYVQGAVFTLSGEFGIPPGNIRVISPFVGGAFGNAARTWVHSVIAAMAAREVKRPVKLVLTRRQMYFAVGFRPAYEYGLRLGADRGGRLTASTHDVRAESSRYETYSESVLVPGRMLYSTPNVRQAYDHVPLDVSTPWFMRGPGYASGAYPVESAMDELAHELGVDPIELRLRNEPADDESSGLPFSTRRLRECYRTGAREFGWHRRNPKPRSTRDGDWLIGMGVAAGVYDTARSQAQASVRLDADGTALVQSSTSDMGPGTATSMSQVAADALGLTMRQVTFRLGDSLMPPAPVHAGSMTMASVGSAVQDGCDKLRKQAITLAVDDEGSPLYGADAAGIVVRGGRLYVAIGAMTGGIGQALLEHTVTDHRDGRIVNANFADYLVPSHADIHDLKAIFIDG